MAQDKKNKFKNVNGVLLLKELFFETASNRDNVLYTLKSEDHEGFPSLYRLYMEVSDPTEYQFAIQYLDGWKHWKTLSECSWMKPFINEWRDELNVRIRSSALQTAIKKASSSDKDALTAAKYVEDVFGDGKTKNTRGRPSKAEIKANAEQAVSEATRLKEDYSRLTELTQESNLRLVQ